MAFPQIQLGTIIWRPVLPHLLTGLAPVVMPLGQRAIKQHGLLRQDPARGWANWGDVDDIGSPPFASGWRVGQVRGVGTPLLFDSETPRAWTHLRVTRLKRRKIYGRLRLVARVTPHTDGRQELFDRALEWFDETLATELGPEAAGAHRLRIFDLEKWELNWQPYENDSKGADAGA